jgi:hypothetical protein
MKGSPRTNVISASCRAGMFRERKTSKIRRGRGPKGRPVSGSFPVARRRSSPASCASSVSIRWSRRTSSTVRVTSTVEVIASASRQTKKARVRVRRLEGTQLQRLGSVVVVIVVFVVIVVIVVVVVVVVIVVRTGAHRRGVPEPAVRGGAPASRAVGPVGKRAAAPEPASLRAVRAGARSAAPSSLRRGVLRPRRPRTPPL